MSALRALRDHPLWLFIWHLGELEQKVTIHCISWLPSSPIHWPFTYLLTYCLNPITLQNRCSRSKEENDAKGYQGRARTVKQWASQHNSTLLGWNQAECQNWADRGWGGQQSTTTVRVENSFFTSPLLRVSNSLSPLHLTFFLHTRWCRFFPHYSFSLLFLSPLQSIHSVLSILPSCWAAEKERSTEKLCVFLKQGI